MPREDIRGRLEEVAASLNLSDKELNELRKLILDRCSLSLKVAELKVRETPSLPKDREAMIEFVKRRKIEEGLLAKISQSIDFGTMERKRAVIGLLELILDISRELQVSYLLEMARP